MTIAALILSAGESRRMGSAKALLPFPRNPGETFLQHLVSVFASTRCQPILVVVGHDAERIKTSMASLPHAPDARRRPRFVLNERYRKGMLSSIRAGIGALPPDAEGLLLCPVDHPDIRPAVVELILRRFEECGAPVVLPVHRGKRGHPVLFSRAVFDDLLRAPDSVGARRVVWDHQEDLLEVDVSDPGVTVDVDTPSDLAAFERDSRAK